MNFTAQHNNQPFKINGRVGEDTYRFNQRIEVQRYRHKEGNRPALWEWHCNVSECQTNDHQLEFWTTITGKPVIILIEKKDILFLQEGVDK